MLVSQSSDKRMSPPQWIHRTTGSYAPNDIENISRQFPKNPGNPLDARQMSGVLTENDNMEDNRRMTTTEDIRRNTAVECFHYNAAHRVLICREHGYAVASWKRHLSDYHACSTSDAKDAARFLKDLDVVRPEDATTPLPDGPPVPYMQQSRVGFECRGTSTNRCGRTSISRATMAQHCNKTHAWRSSALANTNWNEVRVQSFCLTSGKQRWFVVGGEQLNIM